MELLSHLYSTGALHNVRLTGVKSDAQLRKFDEKKEKKLSEMQRFIDGIQKLEGAQKDHVVSPDNRMEDHGHRGGIKWKSLGGLKQNNKINGNTTELETAPSPSCPTTTSGTPNDLASQSHFDLVSSGVPSADEVHMMIIMGRDF